MRFNDLKLRLRALLRPNRVERELDEELAFHIEHEGWIEAEWRVSELGRRAKYYHLTASGRRQLAVEAREWERMANAIGRVMKLA